MSINLLVVKFSCGRRVTGVSFAWTQSLAQNPPKSSPESLLSRQIRTSHLGNRQMMMMMTMMMMMMMIPLFKCQSVIAVKSQ